MMPLSNGLYRLDDLDLKIIKLLTDDATLSTKRVAALCGRNIKLVREHLGMLKEYKIIEKYTIDVAWNKVEES